MASKDINTCSKKLIVKYSQLLGECELAGIKIALTCTHRDKAEQLALYCQGRQPLLFVNYVRRILKLSAIVQSENKIVTWTMDSKHCIIPSDAFDIVLLKDNRVHWNLKVDVNNNDIPDYIEVARIGLDIGLKPGAYFSKPDYPHFEI